MPLIDQGLKTKNSNKIFSLLLYLLLEENDLFPDEPNHQH